MSILITGGAGFIGSHTAVEFLNAGYDIVIADNYCNSSPKAIERIKQITGKDFRSYEVDLCDKAALEQVFIENPEIESAIHFAGLKAVGESVAKPGLYYYNNLVSTLNLVDLLGKYDAKRIVFSSSATVYGMPKTVPICEDFPLSTTNPYGETKLMIERILKDLWVSDHTWSVSVLRYFNPIGAHKSGLIGENPRGIPNNLLPYVAKVA
ncbi:MAG: NAD-dependent epimerase/dehydratase family protein, partial [Clostridia bacterium]|nr:NAD-dependent epimerase/dehydratase family protein [Clostridia bacterium]